MFCFKFKIFLYQFRYKYKYRTTGKNLIKYIGQKSELKCSTSNLRFFGMNIFEYKYFTTRGKSNKICWSKR